VMKRGRSFRSCGYLGLFSLYAESFDFQHFFMLKRSLGERAAYAGTIQESTGRLEFFATKNEILLSLGKAQN